MAIIAFNTGLSVWHHSGFETFQENINIFYALFFAPIWRIQLPNIDLFSEAQTVSASLHHYFQKQQEILSKTFVKIVDRGMVF